MGIIEVFEKFIKDKENQTGVKFNKVWLTAVKTKILKLSSIKDILDYIFELNIQSEKINMLSELHELYDTRFINYVRIRIRDEYDPYLILQIIQGLDGDKDIAKIYDPKYKIMKIQLGNRKFYQIMYHVIKQLEL